VTGETIPLVRGRLLQVGIVEGKPSVEVVGNEAGFRPAKSVPDTAIMAVKIGPPTPPPTT
jgi:hypothetical protein